VTLEGSVVTVADATDITGGRGKISFDAGKIDIHAISALSIRNVAIQATGGDPPIAIEVDMRGEAGIFQVEQTLIRKLLRTPLHNLITVRACIYDPDPTHLHLIDCVTLTGQRLQPSPPD
jgi:metal-dependent HD superfamily phosphatase/phosphodiesterase